MGRMGRFAWSRERVGIRLVAVALMVLAGTFAGVSAPKALEAQACISWEELFISNTGWWCEPTCCMASCCESEPD